MTHHVLTRLLTRPTLSRWVRQAQCTPGTVRQAQCTRNISVMRPTIHDEDSARSFVNSLSKSEKELLQVSLEAVHGGGLTGAPPLTSKLLWTEFLYCSIPFLGFGFLDNSIMLCAGEYIDLTLGATLGISTLAAAAFGNLISDVAGIGMAGTVENNIKRFLGQSSVLTSAQREMPKARYYQFFGRCVGICVGCLFGMWPLLLYSKDVKEEELD